MRAFSLPVRRCRSVRTLALARGECEPLSDSSHALEPGDMHTAVVFVYTTRTASASDLSNPVAARSHGFYRPGVAASWAARRKRAMKFSVVRWRLYEPSRTFFPLYPGGSSSFSRILLIPTVLTGISSQWHVLQWKWGPCYTHVRTTQITLHIHYTLDPR
jgi:hypothetical protein